MRETWAFQNIPQPQEGQEEELSLRLQQAFLQGLHQAHKEIVQEFRQTLLKIVRARFPNLARLAKKQTAEIEDSVILRDLIVKMSIAQTTEDAVMYLLEVNEDDEDED